MIVVGAGVSELEAQIATKRTALEALEQEEAKYNEELQKAQSDKKTLNNELSRIKGEINAVNFKIKVSEAQLDKLTLEVEKLSFEQKSTEEKISIKKELLADSIRNLYEADKVDNALSIILTANKLSDTLIEIENLVSFSDNVKTELNDLQILREELESQKDEAEDKQQQVKNEERNLKNKVATTSSLKEETTYLLTATKNKEQNYQALLSDIEKKRSEVEAELGKLEESLQLQIDPNLLPKADGGILTWPAIGNLTQGYGKTPDAVYFYNRGIYSRPFHNGIDIGAPLSSPIYSAEDGEVIAVGNQDAYRSCYKAAYGKFVVIKHDNNLTSLYAHLSSISVKNGDRVKRGDVIASMGTTGASTGSHLHFSVYYGPTFQMSNSTYCGPMPAGGSVNPLDYLK